MFSYSSASFSDYGTYIKYSAYAELEVMLSDLEAVIHTLKFKSVASLAS